MRHHTAGHAVGAYSHSPRLLFVLTQHLLCFDNLAQLNTQSNNSSRGEEQADMGEEGKKRARSGADR